MADDFCTQANDLTTRFRKRGYPHSIISNPYLRARSETQQSVINNYTIKEDQPLRVITNYNNQRTQIRLNLSRHWTILTSDSQILSLVYVGQTSQELRKGTQKLISTINLAATDLKKVHR
ncbi:uncharacterized protein ACNLHF_018767 [Anomaloglossus baeobatrachus]